MQRITGDDLRTYAAGHYPEPYASIGNGPYYDVIARLVNQATATRGTGVESLATCPDPVDHLQAIEDGIRISIGEILADRIQDKPHIGDGSDELTQAQWNGLCLSRAHEYLEWLQPPLEPATVVIDRGIKREETQ